MNKETAYKWLKKIGYWIAVIIAFLFFVLPWLIFIAENYRSFRFWSNIYTILLPLCTVTLIILLIFKVKFKWYQIVLSAWIIVPTFSFLLGTKDYFTGQAAFIYENANVDREFFNLDKEYRVWRSMKGLGGIPFILYLPNNWAIKLSTNLFGYQKGVYTGVLYPDRNEAWEMVENGINKTDELYLSKNINEHGVPEIKLIDSNTGRSFARYSYYSKRQGKESTEVSESK